MRALTLASVLLSTFASTAHAEQDCQLDILHSAIGDTHSFNLKVNCAGNYNTLTYLLRSKTEKNGVTRIDSESGDFLIRGDSKTTGAIEMNLQEGDKVSVEARIVQACEVLGETTLEYQHQP